MKWLGIHDHANWSGRWIDPKQPYSWLRAFEKSTDNDKIAILAEKYDSSNLIPSIRGVDYIFYKNDKKGDAVKKLVIEKSPDVFLINICWYGDFIKNLITIRKVLPKCRFVIRVHHDVSYLKHQSGFLETLNLCQTIIVSTDKQKEALNHLGFSTQNIYVIPFGINHKEFDSSIKFEDRDIDLVSFINNHPARNLKIVKFIYKIIGNKFKIENHTSLTREVLASKLSRSKFMLLSSLTEASGSRIMLEAIAAGCTPIIFEECSTALEVLNKHNCGYTIKSGLKLRMPEKKVTKSLFSVLQIKKSLLNILSENKPSTAELLPEFYYENEIEKLYKLLEADNS